MLAIDPGKYASAYALFEDVPATTRQVLQGVGYCENRELHLRLPPTFTREIEIVIELPQVYRASQSKGDPNDLIAVAFAAGQIIGRLSPAKITTILPRQWKGQVTKPISHYRMWQKLTPNERCALPDDCEATIMGAVRRGSYRASQTIHNVLDAVAIGMFAIGRL